MGLSQRRDIHKYKIFMNFHEIVGTIYDSSRCKRMLKLFGIRRNIHPLIKIFNEIFCETKERSTRRTKVQV